MEEVTFSLSLSCLWNVNRLSSLLYRSLGGVRGSSKTLTVKEILFRNTHDEARSCVILPKHSTGLLTLHLSVRAFFSPLTSLSLSLHTSLLPCLIVFKYCSLQANKSSFECMRMLCVFFFFLNLAWEANEKAFTLLNALSRFELGADMRMMLLIVAHLLFSPSL